MSEPIDLTRLRLRYAGNCRDCGAGLAPGAPALHDKAAKRVVCPACAERSRPVANAPTFTASEPDALPEVGSGAEQTAFDASRPGTAGASARREFERLSAKRERRIRQRHPKFGGLILAFSDDPQTTTAWQRGATGEELLGRRLDGLTDRGVRLLHDRRIPGTRANIDHIAVSAAGVAVLDAKHYKGRPNLRIEGGILRPRVETLMVDTRKCNRLVEGMTKQVRLVTQALAAQGADVPVTGMLVFVDADWPIVGGAFVTQGVTVLWPKKATEDILKPGPLTAEQVNAVHRRLAVAFPQA